MLSYIIIDIFFPIAVGVIFLVTIIRSMAHLSGWKALSERFPDHGFIPTAGAKRRWQRLGLRLGWYNHVIIFEPLPVGLRISLPLSSVFGHNPILIPWSEFRLFAVDRIFQASLPDVRFNIKMDRKTAEWVAFEAGKAAAIDILAFSSKSMS